MIFSSHPHARSSQTDPSAGRVMLLGTGAAAVTALWNLAAAGAHVRWYVDRADVGTEAMLARGLAGRHAGGSGSLELTFDDPRVAPLGNAVVAACGDDLDREIAERARASRVPVHVVGRPEISTAALPQISAANRLHRAKRDAASTNVRLGQSELVALCADGATEVT